MTERLQTCFLLSLAIAIMGVQIGVVKDSPFRLDDVRQIPVWRDKLREELGLSKLPEATVQAQERGRFRPLLWLHFGLISRLQHGSTGALGNKPPVSPLDPFPFYIGSLLLHWLACGALFLLLRSLGISRTHALLGLLLGLMVPCGLQAMLWIAAASDLLLALFLLLALLSIARGHPWLAAVFIACLPLCKDSAPFTFGAFVVIATGILLTQGQSFGKILAIGAPAFLGFLTTWIFRSISTGHVLPTHPSGAPLDMAISAEGIARYLRLAASLITFPSFEWNPEQSSTTYVLALPALLLLLVGARRIRDLRTGLKATLITAGGLALTLPFVVACLPENGAELTSNRLLHAPALLLYGLAAVVLSQRTLLALLMVTACLFSHQCVLYTEGSAIVRSEMQAILSLPKGGLIAPAGNWHRGYPLVGAHHRDFLSSPHFASHPRPVSTADTIEEAVRLGWLRSPGTGFVEGASAAKALLVPSHFRIPINEQAPLIVVPRDGTFPGLDTLCLEHHCTAPDAAISLTLGQHPALLLSPVAEWSMNSRVLYDLRGLPQRMLHEVWHLATSCGCTPHLRVAIPALAVGTPAPAHDATWALTDDARLSVVFSGEAFDWALVTIVFRNDHAPDWHCEYQVPKERCLLDPASGRVTVDLLLERPTHAAPAAFHYAGIPALFDRYGRGRAKRGVYINWSLRLVKRGEGIVAESPTYGLLYNAQVLRKLR